MTAHKKWQAIKIINNRGNNLAALVHTPAGVGAPAVVVCHGFTGSKEGGGMAMAMGEELGTRGYNVLLFDFSGNGESEGLFENLTLSKQVDDLSSAVDWCLAAGMGPVFTMGRSFGGTTAICHAAADRRVSGVCTWAAPARLKELFLDLAEDPADEAGDLYMLAGEEGIIYLRQAFFDDLENYDVPALAGKISPRPLLIIQGDQDDVVSPSDAELIFQGANEPRDITFIPGADHQFSSHNRIVWDIMFSWLDKLEV